MKTTSQESVRTLFNLSKEEKVYDDFGCAYLDVILYHGRLFLTENFICFNSNILGLKNKCVLSLRDVKEIKKRKTLGIFNNSIIIVAWDEKKKQNSDFIFTTFASRNIAYKRIKMVWKSACRMHNITTEAALKSDSDSNSSKDEVSSSLDRNRIHTLSDTNSIDQDLDGSIASKENVYFPPIDPDKVFEGCKITIKETCNDIFERFIKDNAEFGFGVFYEQILEKTNVIVTDWKQIEENVFVRDVDFNMKVKDVPFISQTRVHKIQKLKKEGDKFTFWGSSSSLDVPYSSYFTIEDTWEFVTYDDKCVLRTTIYAAFTKSTMFKSKIEKKTKEEFKKEIDKWCEFITSKGIIYENYKPPIIRKSLKPEEENLKHGLEKNELKIFNLITPRKKLDLVKEYIFDIYARNFKEFLFFLCSFFIIVLLLVLISKMNRIITLHEHNSSEISYLKRILHDRLMETHINNNDTLLKSINHKLNSTNYNDL